MLCAILVSSDLRPSPAYLDKDGNIKEDKLSENVFWNLYRMEGVSCLLQRRRRQEIRTILHRHIRSSCGGYKKAVERMVKDMLAVSMILKAKAESSEARKELLAMAIHLCHGHKVDNAKLMKQLIIEHFIITGTLVDWYEFLNPFGNLNRLQYSTLYPFKSERQGLVRIWSTRRHLQALEYYLYHGNQVDLYVSTHPHVMQVNGQPIYTPVCFADFPLENYLFGNMTPLALACLIANPQAVLLLLRFGASYLHPFHTTASPHQNWCQPLFILVNQLNLRDTDHMVASSDEGRMTLQHLSVTRSQRLLECLDLLSRSTPSLPLKFQNDQTEASTKLTINLKTEFAQHLPNRCRSQPSELQHLCRCKIRKVLQDMHKLPHGLEHLPVPQALIQYLDLRRDF